MSFDDLDNHIQFLHCHTASNSQQIPMSDKKTTTFMDTIVKTTLLNQKKMDDEAVSYTHLTLPTNREV